MSSQFYLHGNGGFTLSIEPADQSSQIRGILFLSSESISCLIELKRFVYWVFHGQTHNENQQFYMSPYRQHDLFDFFSYLQLSLG